MARADQVATARVCADPSCGAHLAELPQGRKAARAGGLWAGARGVLQRTGHRRTREPGALPQVPPRQLRRGQGAGPRHRSAAAGAAQRAHPPRLPVQRSPRLRQDLQRAHPGPVAQLRAGPDPRPVRDLRQLRRARAARPGLARRRGDRRGLATVASTTPGTCASGRSTRRCPAGTRSTSSTRPTWSRPPASTPCSSWSRSRRSSCGSSSRRPSRRRSSAPSARAPTTTRSG